MQVTFCPRWKRRWVLQSALYQTWVSSATEATGRKFCCDTCTTSRAKRFQSKVSSTSVCIFLQIHVYRYFTLTHVFYLLLRDQSGNCSKSCGHCEYAAISADAEVLERQTPGIKETGEENLWTVL